MDTVYSVIQVVLGLLIAGAGLAHIRIVTSGVAPARMEWIGAVPRNLMLVIAVLEIVGGLALVGTVITGMTGLAALTAACVALLMLFAMVFHARRPGEAPNIAFNAILGVLAVIVLYANLT